MSGAAEHGLVVTGYHADVLDGLSSAMGTAPTPQSFLRIAAAFDVVLTDAVLTWALDVNARASRSRAQAARAFEEHTGSSVDGWLESALGSADLAGSMRSLGPEHPLYERLRRALPLASMNDRLAIIASMERLRWLPATLGARHVLVNLAAYQLELVVGGQVVEHLRVVGGKPGRRTPLLSSVITAVVLNPSWDVPVSIADEEILPHLRRDPLWAERHGFSIRMRTDRGLVPVDAASVDWRQASARTYRFRQKPGPRNPLGTHKFVFENPYQVYLHGTPAMRLFDEERRDFSHGCVRVEAPRVLAEFILPEANHAALDESAQNWKERRVPVPDGIPVHITYLTAVADGERGIRVLADVEERDAVLLGQMGHLTESAELAALEAPLGFCTL